MPGTRVVSIHVYPAHGEPGLDLPEVTVQREGLDGDRRKKAAVHLVAQEASEGVRANFVLTVPLEDLAATVGHTLTVGGVELEVQRIAGNCAGVYAAVRHTGSVRVGDEVHGLVPAARVPAARVPAGDSPRPS